MCLSGIPLVSFSFMKRLVNPPQKGYFALVYLACDLGELTLTYN